ncbi:MAG: molecular chaperone TorD family protein [Rhodobacteraceae bacterium]|nr:molecular chaperone TorD family protein [Paracoccaceae bacterium]
MAVSTIGVAEEDLARAQLYDLLGAMLASPPKQAFLDQLANLTGDESEIGRAIKALRKLAAVTTEEAVAGEYAALFIGVGRGELLPYCSYYRTGFLNEKPLAELRKDLAKLGIKRAKNVFEPEDSIASMMEIMATLISGRLNKPASLETQKRFFDRHILPWARHFYSDLEKASSAALYAPVGALGRAFMEVEAEAFTLLGIQSRTLH